jgi:uncharacterized protein YjbI with pentapeptide repeats
MPDRTVRHRERGSGAAAREHAQLRVASEECGCRDGLAPRLQWSTAEEGEVMGRKPSVNATPGTAADAAAAAGSTERAPRTRQRAAPARAKSLLDRIRNRESLAGADLRFLWFVHWDLSGRDLRAANLRGTQLTGSDLSGCDLRDAVLEAANLKGASLREAQLDNANLQGALVHGADFRRVRGLTKATLWALQTRGAIVSEDPPGRERP